MKNLKVFPIIALIIATIIHRTHSSLFFPSNSAYGIFAAIAVPLDLPHRNVFVSYNFEANYNLPETWNLPPYATGIEEEDLFEDQARLHTGKDCTSSNCTMASSGDEVEGSGDNDEPIIESAARNVTATRRKRSMPGSLLTRRHFYRILVDKFKRSGFEGEPCLLRLICETNASELGDVNGVLGSLIHIMFSPSTSKNENLPLRYYQAEVDGIYDQCHHYTEMCTESVLDLFSSPLHEIIDRMMGGKGL